MKRDTLLKVKIIVYMETDNDTIDQTFIGSTAMREAKSFYDKKMRQLDTATFKKNLLKKIKSLSF
jgi:hypothetical protein